jgi:predicted ATPase
MIAGELMAVLEVGSHRCYCTLVRHTTKLIVLTGGPGAGKTAVLEMARRVFCTHVTILPESASLLFNGGFPRHRSDAGRRAVQRGIFHVQREIERLALEEGCAAVALCDRGTIDGLAYWPSSMESFWDDVNADAKRELERYDAVIHMETPASNVGYNTQNPLRSEPALEARMINDRILEAWKDHPRRSIISSTPDFLDKAVAALKSIAAELPKCCHGHSDTIVADKSE